MSTVLGGLDASSARQSPPQRGDVGGKRALNQREVGPHTRETQQGRVRDDKDRHASRKVT